MSRAKPGAAESGPRQDSVAHVMQQWSVERPDLGPRVPSIVGRILRLASHMRKHSEKRHAARGLPWEVAEIIIALRRSGPPFEMTPTALYKSMLLTSGTITSRLDKAEAAGLVRRTNSTKDRRSVKVRLTPAGKAMADASVTSYYADMKDLLAGLKEAEARQLAALLSKLLLYIELNQELEGDQAAPPDKE